jgi:hypothetical protein
MDTKFPKVYTDKTQVSNREGIKFSKYVECVFLNIKKQILSEEMSEHEREHLIIDEYIFNKMSSQEQNLLRMDQEHKREERSNIANAECQAKVEVKNKGCNTMQPPKKKQNILD